MSDARFEPFARALQARVDAGAMPGAVAVVREAGGATWCQAFGRLAPDGAPMPQDAVFRIYSMTKAIVSVAALTLVEEGRLLLTEPVSRWIPAFAKQRVMQADGTMVPMQREATVHDLLRHTAGLTYEWQDGPQQAAWVEADLVRGTRTNAELAAVIAQLPLAHQPGGAWAYSRATDVLGAVLEKVAGCTLGELLQQRVLGPLGMAETGFHVPPERHARIAQPFAPREGEFPLSDPRTPPALQSGGGGLVSTAADYTRFGAMLAEGGTLDGVRILGPHTVAWMAADHLGPIRPNNDILPEGYGFGLGFAVRLQQGIAARPGSPGTYGWSGAAGTVFSVDPQLKLFSMVLVQAPSQLPVLADLMPNTLYGAL